ncbi:MAG: hypothetical protein JKY01_06470 [Pseudomonadales bacterium]|nr:hypothetical protein [Pseudomonadales bacterium]
MVNNEQIKTKEQVLKGLQEELTYVLTITKKMSDDKEIRPNSLFGEDLGMDSLDIVEFVARSEARFRFHAKDEDFEFMHNLNDVSDFVCAKLEIEL